MHWFMVPAVPLATIDYSIREFAVAVALLTACVPAWLAARHTIGSVGVRKRSFRFEVRGAADETAGQVIPFSRPHQISRPHQSGSFAPALQIRKGG